MLLKSKVIRLNPFSDRTALFGEMGIGVCPHRWVPSKRMGVFPDWYLEVGMQKLCQEMSDLLLKQLFFRSLSNVPYYQNIACFILAMLQLQISFSNKYIADRKIRKSKKCYKSGREMNGKGRFCLWFVCSFRSFFSPDSFAGIFFFLFGSSS